MAAAVILFNYAPVRGTIAALTFTPGPPDVMSNGFAYYLAGKTYDFTVNVVDPDITGWAQLSDVRVVIPNSTAVTLFINPSGAGTGLPVSVSSGTVDAAADVAGSWNNCTVTFKVTFRWNTEQSDHTANRAVTASAMTTASASQIVNLSYGVRSSIRIFDFARDGVAADGMVSPWHDGFNVTGTIVYDIPGAAAADAVDTAEIASAVLYRSGISTGVSSATDPAVTFAMPAMSIPSGTYSLRVRAVMNTPGGPETSVNALPLNCDEVEITGITFFNGGGIDTPVYYRSVTPGGTEVRVNARMRYSLGSMAGNTTVRITNYTDGQDIDVVIPNGMNSGTVSVPAPVPAVAAGTTEQKFYHASAIIGGGHGGDTFEGQNVDSRIQQSSVVSIYWDNGDPPGSGTPFTAWGGFSATAYSLTFNWTGLPVVPLNRDFYSYRVFYRKSDVVPDPLALTPVYQLIDRNTPGFASLALSSTSSVTITGLIPLTNYDYYISAVDIFGNEVIPAEALPLGPDTAGTLASTIRVSLTDSITVYNDPDFAYPTTPAERPLRKTNIRVKIFIVAAGDLPDEVNIILRDSTVVTDFTTLGVLNGVLNTDYYRVTAVKSGTNEWTGYIPDSNPLMALNSQVKFIVETIRSGTRAYADYNSESETPGSANPNDQPFTFLVNEQPQFKPWPTRVLNNVIDSRNPRAYPAYYLSHDAYVTITVYDVKGRPVNTILDRAMRRGGQNIKEGGWAGDNKNNRKLGIGLYHLHFKAERISDGKVILNSFQKVVIKR